MDELKQGNVVVAWVELGEGYGGDYNPDDPDDEELLRFDVYRIDKDAEDDENPWDELSYSYCTNFPASATPEQREKGLEYLMSYLYEPMSKGEWCRSEAERLSWIGLDWLD